jgi:hypothetical protein
VAQVRAGAAGIVLLAALVSGSAVPQRGSSPQPDVPGPPSSSVPAGESALPGLTTHVESSCTGDGTGADGLRVQVLYAVEAGAPDHYAASVPTIRNELANVDDTFAASAAKTGGGRRVRWVFDPATCQPDVAKVVLPVGSLSGGATEALSFAATKAALTTAGYVDTNRRYLVFADATRMCGLGDLFTTAVKAADETAGGVLFARVDTGCWQMQRGWHSTAAHELMHTLGGVQPGAPHAAGGHCSDESDAMCYDDGSAPVTLTYECPIADEALFDCGDDDYFHSSPPAGSYLATSWNTADSGFLDHVDSIGPPPTVDVTGPASVRPGLPAVVTATSSDSVGTWSWTVSPPGCLVGGTTSPSVTIQCPTSGYTTSNDQVTATVTFSRPDGRAAQASHPVTIGVGTAIALTNRLVSSPAYIFYGQTVRITATVTSGSTPVRAYIQVLASTDGSHWTTVAGPGEIGTDGTHAFTVRPALSTIYQLATYVVEGTGWTQSNVIMELPVYKSSSKLTMTGKSGRPDVMTGRLLNTKTGAAISGQRLTLQYRYYGSSTWRTLTTRVTGSTGYVTATVQPKRRTYYRWVYPGSSKYFFGSTSPSAYVRY